MLAAVEQHLARSVRPNQFSGCRTTAAYLDRHTQRFAQEQSLSL